MTENLHQANLTLKDGTLVILREFDDSDADYEAMIALNNAVWPQYPATVEQRQHRDRTRDKKYFFARFLVFVDGRAVALCEYFEPWWTEQGGKYYIEMEVHPDFQQRGIGSFLYDFIMDQIMSDDLKLLCSGTREDKEQSVRFLKKRDFEAVMREPISRLDVTAFDATPFQSYLDRFAASGLTVRTMTDLMAETNDALYRFYELEWDILQDVPVPEPFVKTEFDVWRKQMEGNPMFMPEACFIAMDGETWVGMSCLWKDVAVPTRLYTGLTGVIRAYRRRGIATALKVQAINFAQRLGIESIETDNEENNPMFQLNLRLGFKPIPAWVSYHKKLNDE